MEAARRTLPVSQIIPSLNWVESFQFKKIPAALAGASNGLAVVIVLAIDWQLKEKSNYAGLKPFAPSSEAMEGRLDLWLSHSLFKTPRGICSLLQGCVRPQ